MSTSRRSRTQQPHGSTEALRQSEERFRLMVEAVKDYAIFVLDAEGRIASWNEGVRRIKGYTADEIIGKHFSIFYPAEARASERPQRALEIARREGRFEDEGWRVRKDGTRFWASVVITALRTEDGQLVGFTKVTRDLTERRRHEEALRRSERRLEQAYIEVSRRNRELEDFAHVASHDLQEPLRKMSTFADLLENEYSDVLDDTGNFYVERIRDSAHRMSTLVRALLSYSRVATRRQPFQRVDLNQVVDDVLVDLGVLLEETKGRVEKSSLPTIEADPTQMRQLFQNLIGNALKFHRHGVPPVVEISGAGERIGAVKPGEIAIITVDDNGIGFDEAHVDAMFAPFHRLHNTEEYQGTGLGLAICKRIVERHNGELVAQNRKGEGARFVITLPVEHDKSGRLNHGDASGDASSTD